MAFQYGFPSEEDVRVRVVFESSYSPPGIMSNIVPRVGIKSLPSTGKISFRKYRMSPSSSLGRSYNPPNTTDSEDVKEKSTKT